MENKKKVSIIGATGNLGIPVTKNLIGLGYEVTIIARDTEKAKQYFGSNTTAKFVTADLQDFKSLTQALEKTEYLYLNLSTDATSVNIPFAPEREGIENVLKSVNKSRIKQILIISGLGAFQHIYSSYPFVPNIIRTQGHKLLKESGIPYTIFHCSWFLDSFLLFLRNGTYPLIGNTKNLIYFTNTFDFTNHLSNSIGNKITYNKEYPIQGRKGISHLEAAKQFFQIFDQNIKVKPMPSWLLSILSVFKKEIRQVKSMAKYFENSKEIYVAEQNGTYKDLGEPQLTLEQFAEKVKKDTYVIKSKYSS